MINVQHGWGLLRVLLRAAAGAALLCVRVLRLQSSPCRPESVQASVLLIECALPALLTSTVEMITLPVSTMYMPSSSTSFSATDQTLA